MKLFSVSAAGVLCGGGISPATFGRSRIPLCSPSGLVDFVSLPIRQAIVSGLILFARWGPEMPCRQGYQYDDIHASRKYLDRRRGADTREIRYPGNRATGGYRAGAAWPRRAFFPRL